MQLTEDQKKAVDSIISFVKSGKNLFTMGGYAGTGKTTTISEAISILRKSKKYADLKIAFCCFTGKASIVLREKLQNANAFTPNDYCGTIHGLIYKPVIENDRIIRWDKVFKIDADLIVIDEASMIGDTIFEDLKSYNIPIIAVGDHGQLPPLFSKYNLMENPQIKLEKIHRQAESNPIIKVSIMARHGEKIPMGEVVGINGEGVFKSDVPAMQLIESLHKVEDRLILCARNKTRVLVNKKIRGMFGQNGNLIVGEKIICLKNNRQEKIFNGMIGEVTSFKCNHNPDFLKVNIKFELMGYEWSGDIFVHQFNREQTLRGWKDWATKTEYTDMELRNLFDYGYCITVHKAQGSQADSVVLIDERMQTISDSNYNRWLYTGITRASKNLIIVKNGLANIA